MRREIGFKLHSVGANFHGLLGYGGRAFGVGMEVV